MTFQDLILTLHRYWAEQGCVIHQPYDLEMGAGTFHPATFLRSLGPEPWRAAYPQPCRRPTDGRYGENPNRMQHYYQYQVVLKPAPDNIQALYLESLAQLGINPKQHDIRFIQDDWESPTLGAWGLGWEVRLDGMEITQFTYFQEIGGIELNPITVELTYGTERIAMYLQQVNNVFDLAWNDSVTYGDIHHETEIQFSTYNFEEGDVAMLMATFQSFEGECKRLLANRDKRLTLPAYELLYQVIAPLQSARCPRGHQRGRAHGIYRQGPRACPSMCRALHRRAGGDGASAASTREMPREGSVDRKSGPAVACSSLMTKTSNEDGSEPRPIRRVRLSCCLKSASRSCRTNLSLLLSAPERQRLSICFE